MMSSLFCGSAFHAWQLLALFFSQPSSFVSWGRFQLSPLKHHYQSSLAGDGDADGIVVGEDGGPVVVAGGGAYLRVINENFTVLQKSCSLFRRMKVRNIIKQLH